MRCGTRTTGGWGWGTHHAGVLRLLEPRRLRRQRLRLHLAGADHNLVGEQRQLVVQVQHVHSHLRWEGASCISAHSGMQRSREDAPAQRRWR